MNLGYQADDIASSAWGNAGSGMQAYSSFDMGVEANARQMSMGYQSRLGFVLGKPNSTAAQFMHALTYFKEYKGNAMWAEASVGDPAGYYRGRMDLVKMVRNDYGNTAGILMGTATYEWGPPRLTNKSLITYKDLLKSGGGGDDDGGVDPADSACGDGYGGGVAAIVDVATEEFKKNVVEWDSNALKYTSGGQYAWCAAFASWVYKQAGFPLTKGGAHWRHTTVTDLIDYFDKYEIHFKFGEQDPQPGDMIYYAHIPNPNNSDGNQMAHVAIVVDYDKATKTITTIGGNESDSVDKKTYKIGPGNYAQGMSNYIEGFGRIK
jgi:hypothetical protein